MYAFCFPKEYETDARTEASSLQSCLVLTVQCWESGCPMEVVEVKLFKLNVGRA